MSNRLYMETTQIDPNRTAGQIQDVLGRHGASAILTEYENGEISAISFKIKVDDQEIPFRLPCRWRAICQILRSRKKMIRKHQSLEIQAKRIAWRQILRWIEAQMAFIETGMVKLQEVFMPYIQVGISETLYDRLEDQGFKMIEYEKDKQ